MKESNKSKIISETVGMKISPSSETWKYLITTICKHICLNEMKFNNNYCTTCSSDIINLLYSQSDFYLLYKLSFPDHILPLSVPIKSHLNISQYPSFPSDPLYKISPLQLQSSSSSSEIPLRGSISDTSPHTRPSNSPPPQPEQEP